MQFFVIIPVFNGGAGIAATLRSVFAQSALEAGRAGVSVVVVDGQSTDDTLAQVAALEDSRIAVISEPDTGMYDALAKGLVRAEGDVTCYLPAGETFDPCAFDILTEVFTAFPQVAWVTGRAVTRNRHGQIIDATLPHPYHRRFIDCGMYGTRLQGIQQESTFWRTELTDTVDLAELRKLRLAGDYFLWRSFARHAELYVIDTQLAAFTIEPGQLSKQVPGAYRKELRSISRRPSLSERLRALLHRQYTKRVLARFTRRLIRYDTRQERWSLERP